jgi:minor extracellular serine protease Vpr
MRDRGGTTMRSAKRFGALGGAMVLSTSLMFPAAAGAEDGAATRFERIDVSGIDPQLLPASLDDTRQVKVMLEVRGEPVAKLQGAASRSGKALSQAQRAAARADLKDRQDRLLPRIDALGGRVLAQLQDAYNGIKVRIARSDVEALGKLPGVVAVHAVPTFELDNTLGVPYINGDVAWGNGLTGDGVTVAVIDTGLDYYHANFGGSGDPADFAADDGLTIGTAAFPNAKVVGGQDFAGDDYDADAMGGAEIPQPDPDPLDCNSAAAVGPALNAGHGSHVAGTAAGFGVTSAGSTFSGPYDQTTLASTQFLVGPGVAPAATILAYRVFGCDGSTDVVDEAINQAVIDGAEIINMSLSSPFGGAVSDPTATAAQNAVDAGIVVVAVAGNSGPNGFIVGSPSTAEGVISVAAIDTIPQSRIATIVGGTLNVTAVNANEHPLSSPVTGRLRVLTTTGGGISLGCDQADYAGVQAGDIVVTLRGVCARVDRAIFGEAAGAAAVIMVNNASGLPPLEGPIPRDGGIVLIPFLGVLASAGAGLLAEDGTTVTITDAGVVPNPGYRGLAPFTSGGPRSGDNGLKPDITAPGVSILSTGVGQGTGGIRMSGTSMASPHTAGAAALVREANPAWTPIQVRAALMNTASADAAAITNANPRLAGAGVVRVDRASTTKALAAAPSLSFGYEPLGGGYSETLSFTITNQSGSEITYALSSAFNGSGLGTDVTLPASVTVPAGGNADVEVTLALTAAEVAALPAALQAPGAVVTVRGAVTASPTAAAAGVYPLRVPFLLVPRGLSNVTVSGSPSPSGSATVTLSNGGVHETAADVYAWGQTDAADLPGNPVDVRAVGVQILPGEVAGLPASDRLLVFAINTHSRWSNASIAEFDIAIDVTGSPAPDFFVIGVDLGLVLEGDFDGRYGSLVIDASGNLIDAFFASAPMNGSTVLLPAAASSLGLDPVEFNKFRYDLTAFNIFSGDFDAVAGNPRVRPFEPTSSQGEFLGLAPGASASLQLTSLASARSDGTLGWMIVALDDADGAPQAEVIPLPRRP